MAAKPEDFPIIAYTHDKRPISQEVYNRAAFVPLIRDGFLNPAKETDYPVIGFHVSDNDPYFEILCYDKPCHCDHCPSPPGTPTPRKKKDPFATRLEAVDPTIGDLGESSRPFLVTYSAPPAPFGTAKPSWGSPWDEESDAPNEDDEVYHMA